ncbi:Oxysterol-binding protein-related protein 2 [Babesia sp. Xinjiang]|uniref:Oxysterol-binding protein-related protein 2 n=1 Tax=Babesia sp. Xinjiang TaxID=462227 RepID=UPI000A2446E3|nr:Oxysterol-binding protein-related protein 2 [Babesia sp. Xinjiang]ORM42179.1 Oxysterol-binding protein-related protein 2 [Babesia sp. Xinjiang]
MSSRNKKRYLHEGWLNKWTNFIGSWRRRYFMLDHGCLKYSVEKDGLIKESFILSQCTMRLCSDDPVRLDIDVLGRGVVCLRTDSPAEKQKWYVAFKKAQKILLQAYQKKVLTPSGVYSVEGLPGPYGKEETSPAEKDPENFKLVVPYVEDPPEEGTEKSVDVSELFIKTSFGQEPQTPLNCILTNTSCFDQITTKIIAELREALTGDSLKKIETLSLVAREYYSSVQQLYLEEVRSRKDLEQSLFRVTRRNMKLERQEQRRSSLDSDNKARLAELQMHVSEKSHLLTENDSESSDSAYCGHIDDEFFECEDIAQRTRSNSLELEGLSNREAIEDMVSLQNLSLPKPGCESSVTDNSTPRPSSSRSERADVKIHRRVRLPRPRNELKVSIWSILKDLIGKDLARISMPICLNEPTTALQRDCEVFEYSHLLDTAAKQSDSIDRMAYVTLFSITPYASAVGRTYKPFNPMLGETFELTHRGFNFMAEQVGHHPPICAFHCHNQHFEAYGSTNAMVKLTGKSVEVSIIGPFIVNLLLNGVKENYTLQRCYIVVHNIIIGKIWIETVGTAIIRNVTGGEFAVVQYLRKGWFDRDIHKVRALVYDRFGTPHYHITGKWSEVVYMERVRASRRHCQTRLLFPDGRLDYDKSFYKTESDAWDAFVNEIDWEKLDIVPGSRREMWRPNSRPPHHEHYYGFGYLAMELNELSADYDPKKGACIPPTDSRFRPDLRAYESGDMDLAVKEKHRLEELQREAAKKRIDGESSYRPRWFTKHLDPVTKAPRWSFTGEYWDRKASGTITEGYINVCSVVTMVDNMVSRSFRRRLSRRLYRLASCREYFLHDSPDDDHWMRRKVSSVTSRLQSSLSNLENAILLIVGAPGSGKTYLVSAALSKLSKLVGKGIVSPVASLSQASTDAESQSTGHRWRIQRITLETYNHRDESKCLRYLLMALDRICGIHQSRGGVMSVQDIQDRIAHSLRLLYQARIYLILVLDGVDVFTKGRNDCSESTGSCDRRQGLLYFLGNLIASSDLCMTLICITPDIRITERLEKRVRSRFMHETVYSNGSEDMAIIMNPDNRSLLGHDVDITFNDESKAILGEALVCGSSITSLVGSACVHLPDDAITELDNGRVGISSEAFSSALRDTKGSNWPERLIKQLGLAEHYILVATTRLHCQGVVPVTMIDIEHDLQELKQYFPMERLAIPHFQGLQRIFIRLIHQGVLEWVNFEHNWVGCSEPKSLTRDLHGNNAPCRFPQYRLYLKMDHGDSLPTHLTAWLQLAARTLK